MNSNDSHKVWTQLTQTLTELIEKNRFDVKLLDQTFQNKSKELNDLVKDIKKSNKEKEKMGLELGVVEKAIMKANANIEKAEDKCSEIQEYIEKMSKKVDENKENVENVMNVWNTIGLRIERKDEILSIKFNKISESDPNKWFSVSISIDNNKIKVIECNPKESLDSLGIEQQFNDKNDDKKPDLRQLIAVIRNDLKTNNSK